MVDSFFIYNLPQVDIAEVALRNFNANHSNGEGVSRAKIRASVGVSIKTVFILPILPGSMSLRRSFWIR